MQSTASNFNIHPSSKETSFTCSTCPNTNSSRWHTNPEDPTKKRCRNCYQRAQTSRQITEDATCFTCPNTKSPRWHTNTEDPTKKRCNACYQKAFVNRQQAAGITCSTCPNTKSSGWYSNPEDPTKKRCRSCYGKALYRVGNNNTTATTTHSYTNALQPLSIPIKEASRPDDCLGDDFFDFLDQNFRTIEPPPPKKAKTNSLFPTSPPPIVTSTLTPLDNEHLDLLEDFLASFS